MDDPKFKAAMEACQPEGAKGAFVTSGAKVDPR
jgi:hypothetical protein